MNLLKCQPPLEDIAMEVFFMDERKEMVKNTPGNTAMMHYYALRRLIKRIERIIKRGDRSIWLLKNTRSVETYTPRKLQMCCELWVVDTDELIDHAMILTSTRHYIPPVWTSETEWKYSNEEIPFTQAHLVLKRTLLRKE